MRCLLFVSSGIKYFCLNGYDLRMVSIDVYKIQNPSALPINPAFPDCSRKPLCGTTICDITLTPLKRAQGLVSLMNSTEKVQNLVNSAPGVPRLGVVPYQWWNEGLHGYAYTKGLGFTDSGEFSSATSFPQVINIGAAFDDNLVYSIATVISTETRAFSNRGLSGLDLWVRTSSQSFVAFDS